MLLQQIFLCILYKEHDKIIKPGANHREIQSPLSRMRKYYTPSFALPHNSRIIYQTFYYLQHMPLHIMQLARPA